MAFPREEHVRSGGSGALSRPAPEPATARPVPVPSGAVRAYAEPVPHSGTAPVAELHVHVEGTLEAEMAFELAERNGVRLPFADAAELRGRYAFDDLQTFLDLYYACSAVLRTEDDFADLAAAYLRRAASDGVRHAEIFFDPQAHTDRGVPLEAVVGGLWAAVESSEAQLGVSASLIPCFLRDRGPDAAMGTLDGLLAHRDRIVGVGLDSAEVGHPPSLFADVFARARAEGLHCVAHAGEEGPAAYVWEALDVLHVERIDHGVRCMEDPELVRRLRDEQVPLTVCPLSNVRLGVVERIEDHPLAEMLAEGLAVTVNSDDPAYFGGYVGENFAAAAALGMGPHDLHRLAANSLRAAFVADARRAALLAELGSGSKPSAP